MCDPPHPRHWRLGSREKETSFSGGREKLVSILKDEEAKPMGREKQELGCPSRRKEE